MRIEQAMDRFEAAMPLTRRMVWGPLLAACFAGERAFATAATGISEWSDSEHARVRLIDAGAPPDNPVGGAQRLIGIEVQLDPAYLTYWRSPGEAGVPPSAAFEGSDNIADPTMMFPAPRRFSEDGLEAIGYKEGVLFPVLLTVADLTKPASLALVFSFAVCERQCIPVQAKLALALGGAGQTPEAGLVRDALARVPAKRVVGQTGVITVGAVQGVAGDSMLTVLVKTSGNDVPVLFAEAADPWFVQAGEGLWMNNATLKYELKVLAKPADPAPLPLRLTLVGIDEAIDVAVTLDAPAPKP